MFFQVKFTLSHVNIHGRWNKYEQFNLLIIFWSINSAKQIGHSSTSSNDGDESVFVKIEFMKVHQFHLEIIVISNLNSTFKINESFPTNNNYLFIDLIYRFIWFDLTSRLSTLNRIFNRL